MKKSPPNQYVPSSSPAYVTSPDMIIKQMIRKKRTSKIVPVYASLQLVRLPNCSSFRASHISRNSLSTAGVAMTSSKRPSPQPLLKKRGIPSRTEGERILEILWKFQKP